MIPWPQAWQSALYGPGGFYRGGNGPAAHFRTASHAAGTVLASALTRLADDLGARGVVDVGAGRGELLDSLATVAVARRSALRLHGVDLVGRPAGLAPSVGWSVGLEDLPDGALGGALVVAWELLDTVPCPVLEVDGAGTPRTVLVEQATGAERLGEPAGEDDLTWCRRWWPPTSTGCRIEVGLPRERLWAQLVRRAGQGGAAALLAVDYSHHRAARPPAGTLSGYRAGRLVPPVPDGSCDVTAHVALDAVAVAGEDAGWCTELLTDQRTALRRMGFHGRLAPGPAATTADLARVSGEAELIEAGGLGGFGWLLQLPDRQVRAARHGSHGATGRPGRSPSTPIGADLQDVPRGAGDHAARGTADE